jgi:hypothetical protein
MLLPAQVTAHVPFVASPAAGFPAALPAATPAASPVTADNLKTSAAGVSAFSCYSCSRKHAKMNKTERFDTSAVHCMAMLWGLKLSTGPQSIYGLAG